MKNFIFLAVILLMFPNLTSSYYTNENLLTKTHSQPVWFTSDQQGGYYGLLVDGTAFTQRPINNNIGVRLQKFQIDEAFFYISDRGVIYANSDIIALSMYLTLA